ncbi:peptidoglycan/LPS O-acetylase OafA/YrhL [Streptomyces luteogriseus]|uniref:acyltransferase family protein n=1 Tax=Streptomyces luteogriseus TaxID=68233 RepID=UPI002784D8FF|nr:acyltransferase family protein [Streptomyces luteogriseus]MDQ0710881.1 peptidoglycan/LPS O-acetylase OafA/YrhL [Streptomyces luteogriseus]
MLVVIGLIFFHSALVFATEGDFYVTNSETTEVVTVIAGFGVVWAMPLLFLISGLGARHSLRRRGEGAFVKERLLRLGVPLLLATLLLNPLPQWLRQRAADPEYKESYLDFLPHFFDVHVEFDAFPFLVQGEYFETGHLWFVVLLLTFSLLWACLHRGLPHEPVRRVMDRVAAATLLRRGVLLLPALAFAAICAFVGMEEDYAGWHRWSYLLFFAAGFALAADPRLRTVMRREARPAACLGVLLFIAAAPGFTTADDPFTQTTPLAVVSRALFGAAGWCLVVAIPGLLDRPGRQPPQEAAQGQAGALRPRVYTYLAAAVLPLYVLHQPIVVAVAYFVVGWSAPIAVAYVMLVTISLVLTLAAYELLVRRTRVTRFLFGIRV